MHQHMPFFKQNTTVVEHIGHAYHQDMAKKSKIVGIAPCEQNVY